MASPFSSTAALADSVGINTHLNYGDTAYGNFELVRAKLQSLGVRHLRDGLHFAGNPDALQALFAKVTALAKDGLDFCMCVDPSENLGAITPALLTQFWNLSAMSIRYFEGPNELDIRGGLGQPWPAVAQSFQQALWAAVKAMPSGIKVPVLAPSLAYIGNASQMGDMTKWCDMGNLHPYPGGAMPTAAIPVQISQIATVSGILPVVATETGYQVGSGAGRISEAAQAKYLLRVILDNFKAGLKLSYIYELFDQGDHLGIVRSDGGDRPAFAAIRCLLGLFAGDRECTRSPLAYTLSGAPVQSLLLQKTSTSWVLCLWQEVPVYDLATATDIVNAPVPVTVTLPASLAATVYRPYLQPTPVDIKPAVKSLTVAVDDHPAFVVIEPA